MNAERRRVLVVAGPLAGYEAAFRAHLSRSGYAPRSAGDRREDRNVRRNLPT